MSKSAKILDRLRTIHSHGINVNNADEFIELQRKASTIIDSLDNAEYISILYGRYVLFETWEVIAKNLGITLSYAYRLHKKALDEIQGWNV